MYGRVDPARGEDSESVVSETHDLKHRPYAGLRLEPLGRWRALTLQQSIRVALRRDRFDDGGRGGGTSIR